MEEIRMLAEADECKLPQDVVENNIAITRGMGPYKTSMLLDFEAKRPMEVEAILGNAVRFAKRMAISVPCLSTLYSLISCYKPAIKT